MALALFERLGITKDREAPPPWSTPVVLDTGLLGRACYAMDRHGRGQALWESGGRLWIQTLGPGAGTSFGRLPLGSGRDPRIAMNLEGRGIATWIHDVPGRQTILALPIDPADGHASSRSLFQTAGKVRSVQMAVDRRGGAMVVWSHEVDGTWETLAKRFDIRAKAWDDEPTRLGAQVRHPLEPSLAMNRKGHALVTWAEEGDDADGLVAAFYLPSERLWSDRPVQVARGCIREHRAAVDHAGNLMVLWVNQDYGQRQALAARLYAADRGDWLEPETLATAHAFRQVHLAMTGTGEALAVWLQSEGTAVAFLHSKAYRAGAWEERVTRLDSERGRVDAYAMALGPRGVAGLLCLSQAHDGQAPLLRDRRKDWGAPIPLAQRHGSPLAQPLLSICPRGAAALWRMGTGKEARLVYAQRG